MPTMEQPELSIFLIGSFENGLLKLLGIHIMRAGRENHNAFGGEGPYYFPMKLRIPF